MATSEYLQGLVAQGRTIAETMEIAQDVARKLIDSCIEHGDPLPAEIKSVKKVIGDDCKELCRYEAKYSMKSTEFFERYSNGKLDDRTDFIDWYALMDTKENLLSTRYLEK